MRKLLIPIIILLTGCSGGGGNSSSQNPANSASATINVFWPSQTRFVHEGANFVLIKVFLGETLITSKEITPETKQFTFEGLPTIPVRFDAEAGYKNANSVINLSHAVIDKKLLAGEKNDVDIVLKSDTDQIQVSTKQLTLKVNGKTKITATAIDAQGRAILLNGNKLRLRWETDNCLIADVKNDGTVCGVAVGSTTLTVSEVGSGVGGKEIKVSVQVTN
jgi:hypothetical protein